MATEQRKPATVKDALIRFTQQVNVIPKPDDFINAFTLNSFTIGITNIHFHVSYEYPGGVSKGSSYYFDDLKYELGDDWEISNESYRSANELLLRRALYLLINDICNQAGYIVDEIRPFFHQHNQLVFKYENIKVGYINDITLTFSVSDSNNTDIFRREYKQKIQDPI
jgi:hypothetical protein